MLNLPRTVLEGGKAQTVACPMSDDKSDLQSKLVELYDRIHSEKVDPSVDNALAITTDALNFPSSKINALVNIV